MMNYLLAKARINLALLLFLELCGCSSSGEAHVHRIQLASESTDPVRVCDLRLSRCEIPFRRVGNALIVYPQDDDGYIVLEGNDLIAYYESNETAFDPKIIYLVIGFGLSLLGVHFNGFLTRFFERRKKLRFLLALLCEVESTDQDEIGKHISGAVAMWAIPLEPVVEGCSSINGSFARNRIDQNERRKRLRQLVANYIP